MSIDDFNLYINSSDILNKPFYRIHHNDEIFIIINVDLVNKSITGVRYELNFFGDKVFRYFAFINKYSCENFEIVPVIYFEDFEDCEV